MDHRAVQDYLRASVTAWRDIRRIGPFLATFSRASTNRFLNYAIPDAGARPSAEDVTGLVEAYVERGRVPRLEYLPDLAPEVEAALLHGGFAVERRLALMQPGQLRPTEPEVPVPQGVEVQLATSEADLLAVRIVQHEAYGEPATPGDPEVDSLRHSLASGGAAVLARTIHGGDPAGAGEYSPPFAGVSEITSIGVRTAYRRRGIAAAVTARLLDHARAAGVHSPFLMADEAEARIYGRVGFAHDGEVLCMHHP